MAAKAGYMHNKQNGSLFVFCFCRFDAAVHKQATQTTEEKVFTRRNKNRYGLL